MSLKPKERRSHTTETINKRADKKIDLSVFDKLSVKLNSNSVINVSNSINPNNSVIYNLDSVFKKRIDKLNIKFYFESEKFLSNKSETEKCQDHLYVILFKQISLYIEEVERLNNIIKDKIEEEKILKAKLEEFNKNEKDKNFSLNLIKYLKKENSEIQRKLEEKNKIEDRFKKENEILRRNLRICEDKIQRYYIASRNILNESSTGFVMNRKKIDISDSFRNHPNSAASTKSSTHENFVNKLRVEDFLTNNSSIKNYLEEDSYSTSKNNHFRNSLISNEEDTISKQQTPETFSNSNFKLNNHEGINTQINIANTNTTNSNNIIQGINQNGLNGNNNAAYIEKLTLNAHNNNNPNVNQTTNGLEKKSIVSFNLKSPKGNNTNNTANKNINSLRKNNTGNYLNNNTNNHILSNINANNGNIIDHKNSIYNTGNATSTINHAINNNNQHSTNVNNLHSNFHKKDLKIIKSIKQKNKSSKNNIITHINKYKNIINTSIRFTRFNHYK